MKGKLYETLIGTDARLAITISGEEFKEFIEDVMSDARLKAESDIKSKPCSECATRHFGNGQNVANSCLRRSDQETSTASRMYWQY